MLLQPGVRYLVTCIVDSIGSPVLLEIHTIESRPFQQKRSSWFLSRPACGIGNNQALAEPDKLAQHCFKTNHLKSEYSSTLHYIMQIYANHVPYRCFIMFPITRIQLIVNICQLKLRTGHLRHKLCIRCLSAALAGTREFQERLLRLVVMGTAGRSLIKLGTETWDLLRPPLTLKSQCVPKKSALVVDRIYSRSCHFAELRS